VGAIYGGGFQAVNNHEPLDPAAANPEKPAYARGLFSGAA